VLAHPDATIDHRWEWRDLFERVFGHRTSYLVARRGENVTGVLPLVRFRSRLFGRSLVSVPFLNYGGVLASDAETTAALVSAARDTAAEFGARHVEFRHRSPLVAGAVCRRHKLELTRTLPGSTTALWDGLDKKVRNQVRKAQKDGLSVETGGAELVDDFYSVFARNMRDLGTPVYSKHLFADAVSLFSADAAVHVVRLQGAAVAAGITLTQRSTVIVPWASSRREYRQHCPNMLLYWRMLEHAVASGVHVFDFGRSSPGSGTHQFKVQWGAAESPLHWEYLLLSGREAPDQGPTNPRFAAAIEAWRRLPLWLTNGIGPSIVRNIP
jgi:serine/alanine adding enzyme